MGTVEEITMKNKKHGVDIAYPEGKIVGSCYCGFHKEIPIHSSAIVVTRFQHECFEHMGVRVKPEVVVCN